MIRKAPATSRKRLILVLILITACILPFFSVDRMPVNASQGVQAPACARIVGVTGGFLFNKTATLQVAAATTGAVVMNTTETSGSWNEPQLLTPSVNAGQAIQVKFTVPAQPRDGHAYRKVQLNIGTDCYLMQAAVAAPFLLGYQYRYLTQTLDYIYMRAVNSTTLFSTYIIADVPEFPEYYDVEQNTLAIVSVGQSRRYYEVYTAMDVNTFPNYAKLQFLSYSLGGVRGRPVDLTFANQKPGTSVYDYNPVIAVAPNGVAAVAFRRAQNTSQLGVVFIDPNGRPVYPAGCSNGCLVGNTDGVTQNISIAATADNHFIIAWEREVDGPGTTKKDIGIAVYDAANFSLVGSSYPLVGVLGDPATSIKYASPSLATFNNGQNVYLSYIYETAAGQTMYGRTLAQNGTLNDPQQTLVAAIDTNKPFDTAYLNDSHILVSWIDGTSHEPKATLFNPTTATASPVLNLSVDGLAKERIGVVREYYGRGVITWSTQGTAGRLYYALMDPTSGTLLTPPMLQYESYDIQLGSGFMATAFLPEPMFQVNIPMLRK